MDNFECKAPMYVNFVQSSGLDENDGADKFFDIFTDQPSNEPQEGQLSNEHQEGLSEDVINTPNLAMEHLMTSDRSKAPTSLRKGSVRERSVKREGSPMAENCQPKKIY